jgi:DNA-binding CsgD family transcriptional regulator
MQFEIRDRIYHLWDRLAEFPASQFQQALKYLMEEICQLICADNGYWLSALRMDKLDQSKDVMLGWRPGPIVFLKAQPERQGLYDRNVKEIETCRHEYEINESTLNHVKNAGAFRATLLRDHVSPAFFNSQHYLNDYKSLNITDTLFVVASINVDTEAYFCFQRIGSQIPFTQNDLEIVTYTLRSLNWFHKQVFLSYGLLAADKPLTPTEKKVMHLLLTGQSEKQIADTLQQKVDTTHKHVVNIYRKYNVKSRAGLMAIWLGHG